MHGKLKDAVVTFLLHVRCMLIAEDKFQVDVSRSSIPPCLLRYLLRHFLAWNELWKLSLITIQALVSSFEGMTNVNRHHSGPHVQFTRICNYKI